MRRTVWAFVVAFVVMVAVAPAARALGPGGWDHVGVGSTSTTPSLNGKVYALNTSNPGVLYVGGTFTSAGSHPNARYIARWDGSSWSALGTTPLTTAANVDVRAIAYHDGKVYVGGTFQNAGGHPNADFLAVWNGSSWAPFCNRVSGTGPPITATVSALQIVGNTLYVGGSFANGAGLASADFLVGCDLTTGDASSTVLNDGDINSGVSALTADSAGTLYAGGTFINMDGIAEADHVAAYDGSWHAMGAGPSPTFGAVDSIVRSLAAHGTTVYVGTDALDVAGVAQADHVARWNGSSWSALGANSAGTNGWFPASATIYALATYSSVVIAAGSFQNANGTATADEIAYFDGTHWRPIGSDGAGNGPLNAQPSALGVVGGKVYVGGAFTSAGGDSLAQHLASHALRQPDAMIGATSTGSFAGNNVFSATGAGEIRHVTVTRGTSATSYVKIQNEGLVSASFTLRGSGGATGIAAHYYLGSTNITAGVLAGTYATPSIERGASILVRLVVTVAHSSAASSTLVTTVRSVTGTPSDAVRLTVSATG